MKSTKPPINAVQIECAQKNITRNREIAIRDGYKKQIAELERRMMLSQTKIDKLGKDIVSLGGKLDQEDQ